MSAPMSPERLARAQEIADRAADRFFVEDCEGALEVWRESALVRVARDSAGDIVSWSTPSSYRPSDQVVEIELGSWDLSENAEDDVRREDIRDLVDGRALVPALLAEVERLRAELAARPTRSEVLREATQVAADLAVSMYESGGVYQELAKGAGEVAGDLERIADAAEQGETGGAS